MNCVECGIVLSEEQGYWFSPLNGRGPNESFFICERCYREESTHHLITVLLHMEPLVEELHKVNGNIRQ